MQVGETKLLVAPAGTPSGIPAAQITIKVGSTGAGLVFGSTA